MQCHSMCEFVIMWQEAHNSACHDVTSILMQMNEKDSKSCLKKANIDNFIIKQSLTIFLHLNILTASHKDGFSDCKKNIISPILDQL